MYPVSRCDILEYICDASSNNAGQHLYLFLPLLFAKCIRGSGGVCFCAENCSDFSLSFFLSLPLPLPLLPSAEKIVAAEVVNSFVFVFEFVVVVVDFELSDRAIYIMQKQSDAFEFF